MPNIPPRILITDLYELTMLQAYFDCGMQEEAVFEFFVRELPPGRGYLVAAGLEAVLVYLSEARFSEDDLAWMEKSGRFKQAFIDSLREFRFRGDVHAMPEGTVFFPNEPILRVTAPIAQAQLVETRVINLLQFPTLAATKAARCRHTAPGKLLVDFGLRRAHGSEAGLMAARSSYLAGFDGTSNVDAGARFDIPVYGTMAHSFIEAHDSEVEAFINFARSQPDNVVLLIDTYDTESAARKLAALAPRLKKEKITIQSVRLDSGDIDAHAHKVRYILDDHGLQEVNIFASGGIDEHDLAKLAGAPIDGFGVGSKLTTSADAPYLDCAYKLVEYASVARRKYSEKKATFPGRKQVYRHYDGQGFMCGDIVALEHEPATTAMGEALLLQVMMQGELCGTPESLEEMREYHREKVKKLPFALRSLQARDTYPVSVSRALQDLGKQTDNFIHRHVEAESEYA
jgi:nicotinate phosphoribosyltransferase